MRTGKAEGRRPSVVSPAVQVSGVGVKEERERFIRVAEVSTMVGLGKTTIYKYVSERSFPAPVYTGGNRVAWIQSEVISWMRDRIAERQSQE